MSFGFHKDEYLINAVQQHQNMNYMACVGNSVKNKYSTVLRKLTHRQ